MVTQRVIRISSPRKEAVARKPAQDEKTSSAVAVVDSLINNNDDGTFTKTQAKQKSTAPLCNHPSCTRRAQHPSSLCWMHCAQARDVTCRFSGCNNKGILLGLCPDHGGLVQLCRWRGCINEANLEKRGVLCWMHQAKGGHDYDDDSSSSEEEEEEEGIRLRRFEGSKSRATTDDGLCDRHSSLNDEEDTAVDYVHALVKYNGQAAIDREEEQRELDKASKEHSLVIDLSDVPSQPSRLKSAGSKKEGASKYIGVSFDKASHKWIAPIMINGKQNRIGYYETEEEAAADYARAAFKYKPKIWLDLKDVPDQPLIRSDKNKSGFIGVKKNNKRWQARLNEKNFGTFDTKEEAAGVYARARYYVEKEGKLSKEKEQREAATENHEVRGKRAYPSGYSISDNVTKKRQRMNGFANDLTDVPSLPPIPNIQDGTSKYTGICFDKQMNKGQDKILVDGKQRSIGYHDDGEEEAVVDHDRALVKYNGQVAIDREEEQRELDKVSKEHSLAIDLSDVPSQPSRLKSAGSKKEGASKYIGVSFNKASYKWIAQIMINGKQNRIGYYETEEEAAADYARAAFKYKPKIWLDLKDVPDQPLIRSDTNNSGFIGVKKNKRRWEARLNGKNLGTFDTKEEAAGVYARARYYVEKEGKLSKEKEQREAATENHEVRGKRAYPSGYSISDNVTKKRQRMNGFANDLTDVPSLPPIPNIQDGTSKYTGICFDKQMNKGQEEIFVDGKQRSIGYYEEEEEEAAVDYSHALVKYNGQVAIDREEEQRELDKASKGHSLVIDLSDVPSQPSKLKSAGSKKEGASKYIGVSFDKASHKWIAPIMINGKQNRIGYYETEEEAAADYARAAFKYKPKIWLDLKDVPDQPLIRSDKNKSGFIGVKKNNKRWQARLNEKNFGTFDTKEEAAGVYARARYYVEKEGKLSKEKEQREAATENHEVRGKRAYPSGYSISDNVTKKRQRMNGFANDLTDVPSLPPIPNIQDGTSKYTGICFDKQMNKGQDKILVDGKQRSIGYHDDGEEEAAVDHDRALVKYNGQVAIDREEEQRELDKVSKEHSLAIDLSDVPSQPSRLKSAGSKKEGASKYIGVSFNKASHKWIAQIMINGKQNRIGYYETEEEAAADYARAAFKYKPKIWLDLKDVPDQPLIRSDTNKSGFIGVKKNKRRWEARLNGKNLGTFDTKEEAAGAYARARYYVEKEGELSKEEKEQREAATVTEESIEVVAI